MDFTNFLDFIRIVLYSVFDIKDKGGEKMTLGQIIKQYREEHGMSQDAIAKRSGLSKAYISILERNINPASGEAPGLTPKTINQIAKAINSDFDTVFSELDDDIKISVGKQLPQKVSSDIILSSDLADLDAQLNANGHIELVNYAEFLVSQPEYRLTSTSRRAVRHYIYPVAAGYAAPVEGEDYEMLELDDVPPGADYCITVSGDSMEPYIKDGSLVFVKRSLDLTDFDVGVFYVDGDVLIKQLFVDPMHNIYLLSANPRREDANKMISHNSTSTLMCFGKVLINKLPRPNYL